MLRGKHKACLIKIALGNISHMEELSSGRESQARKVKAQSPGQWCNVSVGTSTVKEELGGQYKGKRPRLCLELRPSIWSVVIIACWHGGGRRQQTPSSKKRILPRKGTRVDYCSSLSSQHKLYLSPVIKNSYQTALEEGFMQWRQMDALLSTLPGIMLPFLESLKYPRSTAVNIQPGARSS